MGGAAGATDYILLLLVKKTSRYRGSLGGRQTRGPGGVLCKFQTVSVDAVVSDVAEALSSVAGGDTTGTLGQSISSRQHSRGAHG